MEDGGLALVTLARPVRVSGKGTGPQPGGGQGSLRPSSLAPSPIICHGEPRRLREFLTALAGGQTETVCQDQTRTPQPQEGVGGPWLPGRRATHMSTGRPGRSSLWVSEKGLRLALSHRPKVADTWEGRCEWPRAARPGLAWERLERPMGTAVAGLGPCGGQKHTCDSWSRPSALPCLGDVEPRVRAGWR